MDLDDVFHFEDLPTLQSEREDLKEDVSRNKDEEYDYKDEVTTDQENGNFKKPKIVCVVCNFQCNFKPTLRKHKERRHKNIDNIPVLSSNGKKGKSDQSMSTKSKISCDFEGCEHKSRNMSELNEHSLRTHIKERSFVCAECNFATNCKGNLQRHQRNKHDSSSLTRGKIQNTKKKLTCDFPDCDYQATSHDLKMHNSRIHMNTKTLKCTLCKFTTHHESYLEKHRRGNHEQNTSYPCTFHACVYKSNWQQSVKAHFRRVHMVETKPLFPCQECDYKGGSEKAVSYHYDARHTDKKQSCPHGDCSYESKWVSSINIHVRVKHGEGKALTVLHCENCEYKTHKSNYMKLHNRNVHINEPKEPLHCDQCSFKTYYQKQLNIHVNEHMGIFTKLCDTCDFKCHGLTKLIRHKITRHNFKSAFMCDQCDYCAPQSSDLKKHLRNMHMRQ